MLLCPGRCSTGAAAAGSIQGEYSISRLAQLTALHGLALPIAGPTAAHKPRCAAISAAAHPGWGKEWSSTIATMGARAARTPAARAAAVDDATAPNGTTRTP